MPQESVASIPRWSVGSETIVYDSPWVRVAKVDVIPPSGRSIAHHVVRLQRVVVVAALDRHNRVLMLRRHRFVTDQIGLELPQGIVENGETSESAARREVLEETGWRVDDLERLVEYQPMIGMVDTPHELFRARDAEYVTAPSDPDEAGAVEWIPLSSAFALIRSGEILGSGSIMALLYILAGPAEVSADRR